MKTFRISRSAVVIFTLGIFLSAFAACKKSNDSGAPANTITATLTTPAGVTTYKSSSTFGFHYETSGQYWLEGQQVAGGDSLIFDFTFYDTLVVNKPYLITDAASGNVTATYIKWNSHAIYAPDYFSPIGTLTVTSMDKTNHTIAGTFSGKFFASSSDSVVISNGKFNITCQEQ